MEQYLEQINNALCSLNLNNCANRHELEDYALAYINDDMDANDIENLIYDCNEEMENN